MLFLFFRIFLIALNRKIVTQKLYLKGEKIWQELKQKYGRKKN